MPTYNIDPSFYTLSAEQQLNAFGVPSSVIAGILPTAAPTIAGIVGGAGAAAATSAIVAAGQIASGGNGGGGVVDYQPVGPLEDVPRSIDWTGIWGTLKEILSGITPGIQESLGEIPEAMRGYAQVHGGAARTWTAESKTRFWMMRDGTMACIRKNGTVKTWKPAKHIVVPRNPRIGTLLRADKRTDQMVNSLAKRAKKRR